MSSKCVWWFDKEICHVGVLELGNIDIGKGLFPKIPAYRHRLCNEMFVDNVEVFLAGVEIIQCFLKELYSETFSLYVCIHCNVLLHTCMYIHVVHTVCAFYRVLMITH